MQIFYPKSIVLSKLNGLMQCTLNEMKIHIYSSFDDTFDSF